MRNTLRGGAEFVGWLFSHSTRLEAFASVVPENEAETNGRTIRTVRMPAVTVFEVVVRFIGDSPFLER